MDDTNWEKEYASLKKKAMRDEGLYRKNIAIISIFLQLALGVLIGVCVAPHTWDVLFEEYHVFVLGGLVSGDMLCLYFALDPFMFEPPLSQ